MDVPPFRQKTARGNPRAVLLSILPEKSMRKLPYLSLTL